MLPRISAIIFVFTTLCGASPQGGVGSGSGGLDLTVLHVNDIHVRIDETNKWSGTCKQKDKDNDDCYGGLARLSTAVQQESAKAYGANSNSGAVFLNGGDFYQGNAWYTLFKWRVVAHFANLLNLTAMAPGNHEFDDHVDGFVPFLKNATFPIIAANIDVSKEPKLKDLIPPSVVVDVSGVKVGIIGYVTTDTPSISNSDNVVFIDEVKAIAEEAARLKASGVNILLALGHSGYEKDQEIAAQVEDIDLVVGGHSHSFLYSGSSRPSVEKPSGPYPTLVTQPTTGRIVPVLQAYAYTKYLGKFKMSFDSSGEMTGWEEGSKPMLLDSSVEQDPHILDEIEPWRARIDELSNEQVAESYVVMQAKRNQECNLGNFVTDSMVDHYVGLTHSDDAWTTVSLAFINSGGLRGSFEIGEMTQNDVLTVLPFGNTIDVVGMTGATLFQVFEEMASRFKPDGETSTGGFLQVSGFRVVLNLLMPVGQRVVSLKAMCARCKVPRLEDVKNDHVYQVAMVSYLADGGDGFKDIFEGNLLERRQGPLDVDVFNAYAKRREPIVAAVEGRVTIINKKNQHQFAEWGRTSSSSRSWSGGLFVLVAAFVSVIIQH